MGVVTIKVRHYRIDCRRPPLSVVLDSSVTVAWLFRDEQTQAVREVLGKVTQTGAVVPSLWRIEVANALLTAIRRGRIDIAYRDASLADLQILDIAIDAESDRHLWSDALALADRFGLAIYDGVYLELAQRRRLPLASLDRQLRDAASEVGLALLGI
jgi:predicted nucleic acid-binding protein